MDGELGICGRQPQTGADARRSLEHELHEEHVPVPKTHVNEDRLMSEDHTSLDIKGAASDTSEEGGITDLFSSLPPIKGLPEEGNPLTVRAVVIGICLGSLCNASNVYLGKYLLVGAICERDSGVNHTYQKQSDDANPSSALV